MINRDSPLISHLSDLITIDYSMTVTWNPCLQLWSFQSLCFSWTFPHVHALTLFFDFTVNHLKTFQTFLSHTSNIRDQRLSGKWGVRSADRGVWKTRSVENAECWNILQVQISLSEKSLHAYNFTFSWVFTFHHWAKTSPTNLVFFCNITPCKTG